MCYLRKSEKFDSYGLVLMFQQQLHIIDTVEKTSPAYRAGLQENDVILFVGKTNVEKLIDDDVKFMIRAAALASNHVELTVISKSDISKYKTLKEKGLIDWSIMGSEK
jgi:C-terminal processing protease CtpA/Prc